MSDTMRDAFEAWWKEDGKFCRAGGGDYEKTFAFHAWQAAQSQPDYQGKTPTHWVPSAEIGRNKEQDDGGGV